MENEWKSKTFKCVSFEIADKGFQGTFYFWQLETKEMSATDGFMQLRA